MTQATKERPATPRQAARKKAELDRRLDAEMFRALSDPTRLMLLACLAKCGRPCTVGELAECCDVDLSVVSRHLALLARSGVTEARKQGRTVLHRVRYAELSSALRALADALDACCPAEAETAACSASGCCP